MVAKAAVKPTPIPTNEIGAICISERCAGSNRMMRTQGFALSSRLSAGSGIPRQPGILFVHFDQSRPVGLERIDQRLF